ncbi:MAG TPA: hypothetical protein PLP33_03880 [Leptospiraceae bacterium]|nr:hypothetical protein [Leptospiraceae bacterium]
MIFKKLENANELIKSIACGIARLQESEKAIGGKSSARSKPHLNVWFTLSKVNNHEIF